MNPGRVHVTVGMLLIVATLTLARGVPRLRTLVTTIRKNTGLNRPSIEGQKE